MKLINMYKISLLLPVKQICQTCEKGLLCSLVLRLVLEHLVPEGFAEVERLEH